MGTQLPLPKGQSPPISAHVCCGQTDRRIKTPLGTEVGLGASHIVSDGDPAPSQRGTASQFSADVCSSQTAGWIKMPLGTKVGLGSGDIVLDGDPAPLTRGTAVTAPTTCRPMSIVANGRPSQLLLSACFTGWML